MSDTIDEPETMTIEEYTEAMTRQLGNAIGGLLKEAHAVPEYCYMVALIQGAAVCVGGGISPTGEDRPPLTTTTIERLIALMRDTLERAGSLEDRLIVDADPNTGEVTMHDVKRDDSGSN
jgi:hypothetical protein